MASYSIPEEFIEGFENIISLTDEDLNALTTMLDNLSISDQFDVVLDKSKNNFRTVSPNQLKTILRTLISIVTIFDKSENNIEEFTSEFSKSFLFSKKEATQIDSNNLKKKLSIILKSFKNLTATVKGQDLLTENQNNFRESRIISDVRMLFSGDMHAKEKNAVIVHNLKIQYLHNRKIKDFFVALDLSDLKKFKATVDRAIEKDAAIKKNQYKFNFLDFNNASDS